MFLYSQTEKSVDDEVMSGEEYEEEEEIMDEEIDLDEILDEGTDESVESSVEEIYDTVTTGEKTSRERSVHRSSSVENPFDSMGDINMGVVFAVPIVSLIITILVFVLLVQKKKAPRSRFLKWLREFLNFRSMLIAGLIKFFYLFLATLLTIGGVVMMFMGKNDTVLPMILIGLAVIVFGNIILRLTMEGMMIMIGLWENTNDMRAVMVKDEETPEEKPVEEPPVESELSAEQPESPVESEVPVEPSVETESAVEPNNAVSPEKPEAPVAPVEVKKA